MSAADMLAELANARICVVRYALDQVVRARFEEREQALREIEAIRELMSTIEEIVRG